jgi:hypothetical protein
MSDSEIKHLKNRIPLFIYYTPLTKLARHNITESQIEIVKEWQ